jgi:hypothetical protein
MTSPRRGARHSAPPGGSAWTRAGDLLPAAAGGIFRRLGFGARHRVARGGLADAPRLSRSGPPRRATGGSLRRRHIAPMRSAASAQRQFEKCVAGVATRGGAVSPLPPGLAASPTDGAPACALPETERAASGDRRRCIFPRVRPRRDGAMWRHRDQGPPVLASGFSRTGVTAGVMSLSLDAPPGSGASRE